MWFVISFTEILPARSDDEGRKSGCSSRSGGVKAETDE